MRFKVGDKVNFLNESGGGTIIGIIDNKLVKLKTKDGFEMPVLSSELIIDYRSLPKDEFAEPLKKPNHANIQRKKLRTKKYQRNQSMGIC